MVVSIMLPIFVVLITIIKKDMETKFTIEDLQEIAKITMLLSNLLDIVHSGQDVESGIRYEFEVGGKEFTLALEPNAEDCYLYVEGKDIHYAVYNETMLVQYVALA